MIQVMRTNEPIVLKDNKRNWTKEYLSALKSYRASGSEKTLARKKAAEGKYNHKMIREQLILMCHGKCVYCESHIIHVDYPHIEHFRPKSLFPQSCFTWKNLFLGCSICNGASYKADKFPSAKEGGLFINPGLEDPTVFFDFTFDPKTGVSDVSPKNRRGRTTEKELGLNRPGLLKHRNPVVKKLAFIALLAKNGNAQALRELKDSMQPDQEYSAFAMAFHRKLKLP